MAAAKSHKIVEIKARCREIDSIRPILERLGARLQGTDRQTDTYFQVSHGRLKLRQGNIENVLIFYQRQNQKAAKRSDVHLYPCSDSAQLLALLSAALPPLVVVRKERQIFWLENIKIHLDHVAGLGSFVEIEAIDLKQTKTETELHTQCRDLQNQLGIQESEMVDCSYSDMLLSR